MSALARAKRSGGIEGAVLLPNDAGYDEARTLWNAMVDRHPRAIVRCSGVADVTAAVRLALESDLEIGVRCGGHSVVGHAVPEDGLMIDLSPMGAVSVDPVARTARVQGGALLGALDRATQRYGLATTAGNVSHTGVGGLTLGGGMGWLARQFGLACDNVLAYEVVTADGRVVRASETEHPDLYWGLRGGGGNFGVVTEFEFRLHPTGTEALTVELDFPVDDAEPVLRGWRDQSLAASRRATYAAQISGSVVTVGYVWVGEQESGRRLLPALRALGRPAAERVVVTSYVDLQTRDDVTRGHALRRYMKGHYFQEVTDDAVRVMLAGASDPHAPSASVQAYGGAIADVADDDTAFSHRGTGFELVASAAWVDPDEDDVRIEATRRYGASLDRFSSGAYVNVLADEGAAGVRRAYTPHKLARLTAVKDEYDPGNVFHLNHNVPPSRDAAVASDRSA